MLVTRAIGGAIVACLVCACQSVNRGVDAAPSAPLLPGGLHSASITVEGVVHEYALWVPEDWRSAGSGIVFLHGLGECGTDGVKQTTVGLGPAVRAHPERWPFVVIMPQKPKHAAAWEDYESLVVAVLDRAVDDGLVDADRVVLTGLSQGGHGTIIIGSRYPERFRALVPVCGYVDAQFSADGKRSWTSPDSEMLHDVAAALSDKPMWVFHGAVDPVVPLRESELLVGALKASGASPRFTVYPEADHNSWDAAYGDPALASWMIEHVR